MLEQMDTQHALLATVVAGLRNEKHWNGCSIYTDTHDKVWLTDSSGKQYLVQISKADEQ